MAHMVSTRQHVNQTLIVLCTRFLFVRVQLLWTLNHGTQFLGRRLLSSLNLPCSAIPPRLLIRASVVQLLLLKRTSRPQKDIPRGSSVPSICFPPFETEFPLYSVMTSQLARTFSLPGCFSIFFLINIPCALFEEGRFSLCSMGQWRVICECNAAALIWLHGI